MCIPIHTLTFLLITQFFVFTSLYFKILIFDYFEQIIFLPPCNYIIVSKKIFFLKNKLEYNHNKGLFWYFLICLKSFSLLSLIIIDHWWNDITLYKLKNNEVEITLKKPFDIFIKICAIYMPFTTLRVESVFFFIRATKKCYCGLFVTS